MSLKYGLLSLLAFFIVLLLILKNYETWTLPIEVIPDKRTTKKQEVKIEPPPTLEGQKGFNPIESNIFIAEKNIFSRERKEFPIFADPSRSKQPIVRPQIVLYGVTIAGNYQSASIVNPGRALSKGERDIMTIKLGDQIGDYKLAKIFHDRITLEAPGDTFEIFLYDAKTPKKRTYAKTENKPASVVSTLTSPPVFRPASSETPREPVREKISETQVPRPVTPASIPTPRSRRWPTRPPVGN